MKSDFEWVVYPQPVVCSRFIITRFLIGVKSHEIICDLVIDIVLKDQVNFENYSVLHWGVPYFYICALQHVCLLLYHKYLIRVHVSVWILVLSTSKIRNQVRSSYICVVYHTLVVLKFFLLKWYKIVFNVVFSSIFSYLFHRIIKC